MKNLLQLFDDLIVEHGSSKIMSAHRDLFRDQLKIATEKIEALEKENTELKKDLSQLQSDLEANSRSEEFVEHRGASFKRKPEGGYHLAVYCPICHKPASTIESFFPYSCDCGWSTDITPEKLESVLNELP